MPFRTPTENASYERPPRRDRVPPKLSPRHPGRNVELFALCPNGPKIQRYSPKVQRLRWPVTFSKKGEDGSTKEGGRGVQQRDGRRADVPALRQGPVRVCGGRPTAAAQERETLAVSEFIDYAPF